MHFRSSHLSFAVLLLACASLTVKAQANATAWSEWETIHPEGEEFSISMPKDSSSESEKFPYHKMELTGRLYLSKINNGPVIAVTSFSGIKSAPALYSDLERFNSYVDAFKTWFPSKVRKDTLPKLVQVGSKTFHGYAGREYKLTIGDLTGVAQAYATRKRFYVIVSLNTKPDAPLQEKFLSSFYLPDRPPDEKKPTTTAENNSPGTSEGVSIDSKQEKKPQASSNNSVSAPTEAARVAEDNAEAGATAAGGGAGTNSAANNSSDSQDTKPKPRAPISGGVLNGKAIYLPLPEVPAGEAAGVVMVQVLVDEQGGVVEARAISGPAQLQAAAVNAARLARFSPTLLSGEPVRVSGTLSYNFGKSN